MHNIEVTNVNQGLADALMLLQTCGVEEQSRNGPVLVFPEPVCTTYRLPCQRVLFSPLRDANPFFHFMEGLWMLAGRNDLTWPLYFNKQFGAYSDDGVTVRGAYGHRWRKWFGYDQLLLLVNELRHDPATRRAVLSMWDATDQTLQNEMKFTQPGDLICQSKDKPCNTQIYFDRRGAGSPLNMTVLCRSNDIWWGCYGANAVHFSMLLEFMAAAIGCDVGVYRQFSNNLHLYTDIVPSQKLHEYAFDSEAHDLYLEEGVTNYKMVTAGAEHWMRDLELFMYEPMSPPSRYYDEFFAKVAAPMYACWKARKEKMGDGREQAAQIAAQDWRIACETWITRREQAKVAGA